MTVINPLFNWTRGAIEPRFVVAHFSFMEPGALSTCFPVISRVSTHDGMLSVKIIRFFYRKLWGIGRGGQCTTRVSRGNRNGSWKWIRGIPEYFVRAGNIINGKVRDIQIWYTKINWKGIIGAVINYPIIVLSNCNDLVLALLWNDMK